MAYAMTKRGSQDNVITYEFICDTLSDLNVIENEYKTIGTIAIVLNGESDGLEVYICSSNKQWTNLGASSINGNTSTSSSLTIYICSQNEVSQGLPNVVEPDETMIYLVPASNDSGNLYEEYIYVNNAWEKFGSGSSNINLSNYATLNDISGFYTKPSGGIPAADLADTYLTTHQDISGKANISDLATVATSGSYNDLSNKPTIPDISNLAPKAGPIFTTNISLGRKAGENYGSSSIACGEDVVASKTDAAAFGYKAVASGTVSFAEGIETLSSGHGSHAEGGFTEATDQNAHAEGYDTTSSGIASHTEGWQTAASGKGSHAEGAGSKSQNDYAHAEGYGAIASGVASHAEGNTAQAQGLGAHAEGMGTIAVGRQSHVEGKYNVIETAYSTWAANTAYTVGTRVINSTAVYECITAHTSQSALNDDVEKWQLINDGYNTTSKFAHIIGNGKNPSNRSNAYALDWNGNGYYKGDIYIGCNADSTGGVSIASLIQQIADLQERIADLESIHNISASMVEGENGRPLLNEQGQLLEFDRPTT